MKIRAKQNILWTPVVFTVAAVILINIDTLPESQVRQISHLRHQQFVEFDAAIRPILRSDKRFEFVSLGEYTGGGRGVLSGFVASTNDLESLRKIYSQTLTNHSAAVGFQVKVDVNISH